MLWCCIDMRILDCLEGDDPAAGERLPGYTFFARMKAAVRRGVGGEDRTPRSSRCADVDLAARVSIRGYPTYIYAHLYPETLHVGCGPLAELVK